MTPTLPPSPATPSIPPTEATPQRQETHSHFADLLANALEKGKPPQPPSASIQPPAITAQPTTPGEPAPEPIAKSIDEIDLEAPAPTSAAATQPAPAATPAPSPIVEIDPSDPMALVTKVATDLGIAPETLTTTSTGRSLLSAKRLVDTLQSPIDKGGLNYLPSTIEITEAFESAAAQDQFDFLYESDPNSAILHLTAPDFNPTTGRYNLRPGALQFIEALPAALDRLGSVRMTDGSEVTLVRQLAKPILEKAADELFSAINEPDITPEEKAARTIAARFFEQVMLNKDRLSKAKLDPEVQRAQEALNQERQRQQQATSQAADQRSGFFRDAVLRDSYTRIESAVDTLLAQTGTAAKVPSYALPALRDKIIAEAINRTSGNSEEGVSPANPTLWQSWSLNFKRWQNAARTATRRDGVTSLTEQYFRLAQPNIRAAAKKYLESEVEKAVQSSQAQHAHAQNGSARVEPTGGPGAARPQSVTPTEPMNRQPGEDQETYMSRIITSRLNAGAAQGRRV